MLFFYRYGAHRDLHVLTHAFPPRRSSDLRHNYRLARELGGHKALAVIKADAYGHGAVRCAQALQDEADGFGVACIEEALELREAGIRGPILLLEGFFEADELALIEAHDLWFVVQTDWQIDELERARPARPCTVWLKLDSGRSEEHTSELPSLMRHS